MIGTPNRRHRDRSKPMVLHTRGQGWCVMTSNCIRLYLTKFLISVIETSKELGTIVAAYS